MIYLIADKYVSLNNINYEGNTYKQTSLPELWLLGPPQIPEASPHIVNEFANPILPKIPMNVGAYVALNTTSSTYNNFVKNSAMQALWVRIFKWQINLSFELSTAAGSLMPAETYVRMFIFKYSIGTGSPVWKPSDAIQNGTPPDLNIREILRDSGANIISPYKRGYTKYLYDCNCKLLVDKLFKVTSSWPNFSWKGTLKCYQTNGLWPDASTANTYNLENRLIWWLKPTSCIIIKLVIQPPPYHLSDYYKDITYNLKSQVQVRCKPYTRYVPLSLLDGELTDTSTYNEIPLPREYKPSDQEKVEVPEPTSSSCTSESCGSEGAACSKEPE